MIMNLDNMLPDLTYIETDNGLSSTLSWKWPSTTLWILFRPTFYSKGLFWHQHFFWRLLWMCHLVCLCPLCHDLNSNRSEKQPISIESDFWLWGLGDFAEAHWTSLQFSATYTLEKSKSEHCLLFVSENI